MTTTTTDQLLQKVWDGGRIDRTEALSLWELPLEELGALADRRRQLAKAEAYEGRGNEIVTYIVDRNVNYTNVCVARCDYCAFYRLPKHPEGYLLSLEQVCARIDAHIAAASS